MKKKLTLSKKTVSNLQNINTVKGKGGSTYGCSGQPWSNGSTYNCQATPSYQCSVNCGLDPEPVPSTLRASCLVFC